MIPIDLWSAEGRAEMRAHLDLIGEIEEAEAKLDTLRAQLPAWLGRQNLEGPTMEALLAQALAEGPIESAEPLGEQEAEPPAGEEQAEPAVSEPAPASPEEIAAWVEEQAAMPAAFETGIPGTLPTPADMGIPISAPEATSSEVDASAAGDPSDPERWIDDDMKAQIWRLDQEGYTAAAIAEEMSLAPRRVQNLLYRIRSGKHPIPGEPSTAVATTSAGGALVVPERGVARDPEMVQQWQDDMAEAERRKFVARSEYPEMRA